MSGVTRLKPTFVRSQNSMVFPTSDLNYLLEEQIYDSFDFYQGFFGVYSYMRVTKDMTHRIYSLSSTPLIWQEAKSCSVDPIGNVSTNVNETQPCKATALAKFCHDELYDSCFKQFLNWDGNAGQRMDANGQKMLRMVTQQILNSMVLGARMTLTLSGLYAYEGLQFKDNVTKPIKELFEKTINTCKGWMSLTKQLAKQDGNRHLDHPDILREEDFNSNDFTGDIFELVNRIYDVSTSDLMCIVDEGGVPSIGNGVGSMPMFLFSSSVYKKVAQAWREQCLNELCKNPRLTHERVSWRDRSYNVYYIDGIPVIPIHDMNQYDRYLDTKTHYAGLTLSGNINLGASFRDIPRLSQPNMGMRIHVEDSNERLGEYSFRADTLFSTLIANTDYLTGSCRITEKVA